MMAGGFKWSKKPSDLWEKDTKAYVRAIRLGVEELATQWSPIIEDYMKSSGPWMDQSANARQGLNVRPESTADAVSIWLAHGVEYGIYLELAHAGAWAIVNPSLDAFGPLVWDSVKDMLS